MRRGWGSILGQVRPCLDQVRMGLSQVWRGLGHDIVMLLLLLLLLLLLPILGCQLKHSSQMMRRRSGWRSRWRKQLRW